MKKILILLNITCMVLLLVGCNSKKSTTSSAKKNGDFVLYYVNYDETKLVSVNYDYAAGDEDSIEQMKQLLKLLSETPDTEKYKESIPSSINISDISINNGYAQITCDIDYDKLEKYQEVLARAAIVKTLCQIDQVKTIEFVVNGTVLTDSNGNVVGPLDASSFIDTNEDYYLYGDVTLYFANSDGDKLQKSVVQVNLTNDTPIEEMVLELLINGPSEENLYSTIPPGTKVLKTSTKDGICYVDLNKEFLSTMDNIKDDVVIYSIVNSLVELPIVNKVQFTIEGEIVEKYRESIEFDGIFERKLDIIETSEEVDE